MKILTGSVLWCGLTTGYKLSDTLTGRHRIKTGNQRAEKANDNGRVVFTAPPGCIRLAGREEDAEHGACWDAEADLRAGGGEVGNQRRVDNLRPELTVGKVSDSLVVRLSDVTHRLCGSARIKKTGRKRQQNSLPV